MAPLFCSAAAEPGEKAVLSDLEPLLLTASFSKTFSPEGWPSTQGDCI